MLIVTEEIRIPTTELDFQYVRSSGPGGQNVNKVATKAVLRWDVTGSPSIPEGVRARFLERHGGRVTSDGDVIISSDRSRSQSSNAEDCLERLRTLLLEVAEPPKPRRPTRPTAGARRRRLQAKRRTAQKKHLRQNPSDDE